MCLLAFYCPFHCCLTGGLSVVTLVSVYLCDRVEIWTYKQASTCRTYLNSRSTCNVDRPTDGNHHILRTRPTMQRVAARLEARESDWYTSAPRPAFAPPLCSHSSSHDLKAQLASSKSALSLARTHTLQRLIEEHGSCSMEAAEAFDHMLEQGVADTYQLRVMMHDARNDSDAQLALMWQAEAAGVRLTMKEHSIVLKSMLWKGRTRMPLVLSRTTSVRAASSGTCVCSS